MKTAFRKFSLSILNQKRIYLTTVCFLSAFAVIALLETGGEADVTVSAQEETLEKPSDQKRARADMLAVALDFRSAAGLNVFAEKGIVSDGDSKIKGAALDAARDGESAVRVKKDLQRAFSTIAQLPCQELNPALTGGNFKPGVYCAESARLAEELILDGDNNSQAIFVFRINGALDAKRVLKMSLINEARAENVFFVTNETAVIEAETDFRGSILAKNSIRIGMKATIDGKVFSLDGEVGLTESSVGGGTGILQICKRTPPNEPTTGTGNLFNRIFRFRIGANVHEVQTGQCSTPIELPVGNYTIEELLDGRTIPNGTFSGRFKLINVNSPTPGALGVVNLPLRTANVFVREGDANNQTVVNFVNTFAISTVVEICTRSVAPTTNPMIDDRDVTGFFDYSIDAITSTVFTIPVGYCSGPILVNAPATPGPVVVGAASVRITQLSEAGYTLESATTFPADRFFSLTLNKGINLNGTAEFDNPRGGYATVTVLEGGAQSQTKIEFFNRSNPSPVKVCKIGGPGIPEGTRFRFTINGLSPSGPGSLILPGVSVTRTVDVAAGSPTQGANCAVTDGTFIVGSSVAITEQLAPLDQVPNVPPGEIRVSRIQTSSTQGLTVNLTNRTVILAARGQETRAEFTNFVFRPTLLKICKIAGPGVAVGTPFTFDVVINDENGLFPNLSVPPVTVQAGPASQGGFCQFAAGPYATATLPTGTFRVGSRISITERAAVNTTVTSITSPTNILSACSPANPRCTSLTLGFPDGFNEAAFTNVNIGCRNSALTNDSGSLSFAPDCSFLPTNPFDFDGDRKTDISIYRSGTWIWIRSSNGQQQSVTFGLANDKLVTADYDGDLKNDFAVYRDGTWHTLQSSNGQYRGVQFGTAGDIPNPGDYDGDGIADLAIFRPSNSTWYIFQSARGFKAVQFGASGDKPVRGDFDGDGSGDITVYRPSNGTWYILQSSDGFKAVQFGIAADKIVAEDYDGDGKTDTAVFRDGWWYIQRSTTGFRAVQFGIATDIPVPSDYNGDRKADIAVYRAGTWHLLLSGTSEESYASAQLGTADDFPVPATYVR